MQSLYDISWKVSEETYRKDPALSYSILAKYEREGFNSISKLHEQIESPSLTFGSAVDALVTGGREEFDSKFVVFDFPKISDTLQLIAKTLFERFKDNYSNLEDIPTEDISQAGLECDFYASPKYENYRIKLIKEGCSEYYRLLYVAGDKKILDTDTYNDVENCVNALYLNPYTSYHLRGDEEDIERYFQLKFRATIQGVDYRCMADELMVCHDTKTIIPIDLKTSSKPEWDFYKSFLDWNYYIQAILYYQIIKENIKNSDLKDYKILNYRFIVVNKKTLTPLVWICPFTTAVGNIELGKNNQFLLRSPLVIGKELSHYLKTTPTVPNGIKLDGLNDIRAYINEMR